MSTSTVFKTANTEESKPEVLPVSTHTTEQSVVNIEVPYLDYEKSSGKPFIAEYFNLGDRWNDREGGFPEEVRVIEDYIKEKINSGESANSISAAKSILKGIEKLNNLTNEERSVVKIEIIKNYIEFMNKKGELMSNLKKYGTGI